MSRSTTVQIFDEKIVVFGLGKKDKSRKFSKSRIWIMFTDTNLHIRLFLPMTNKLDIEILHIGRSRHYLHVIFFPDFLKLIY